MNNKLNKIFSKTDCISEKMLNDYHNDKLSAKEKHSVEKHLIDCELCTDELEGLSLLKDKSQINIIVDEINENIKLRSQNNKPKVIQINFLMKLAASIAILILVGSALFMINDLYKENEQRLAEQIKPSSEEKIPDEKKVSRQVETVETAESDESEIDKFEKQAKSDLIISGKISKRSEIDGDADESTNADRKFETGESLASAGSSSETISKEKESKELIASDGLAESKEEDVVVAAAVSRDRSLGLSEDEISLQPVAVDESFAKTVVEKSSDLLEQEGTGELEEQTPETETEVDYLADYDEPQKKSKARRSAGAEPATIPAKAKKVIWNSPMTSGIKNIH